MKDRIRPLATLTIAGETRTVAQWARISGVNYNTLYYRLRKGVDAATAVFSAKYSTELRREGGDVGLPVYKPRKRRRRVVTPVLPMPILPTWGGFVSLNWRAA